MLEKLLELQTRLKINKSQWNNFGKYSYRNCEDILEAAKPILKELKATIVLDDEIVYIGERYYVKATARFIDLETKEEVSNHSYAREEREKKGMDASQITGSCSSYARKYALTGLLLADDGKDADAADNTNNKVSVQIDETVDQTLLDSFKGMPLEDIKEEIRNEVTAMSEKDPNLEIYQAILLYVTGNDPSLFKVKDCGEDKKPVLDNILMRLKVNNK